MNFKECRKYGREEILKQNKRHGYMYRDTLGQWYFFFERFNTKTMQLKYVLEKNGVVNKVDKNGHWK